VEREISNSADFSALRLFISSSFQLGVVFSMHQLRMSLQKEHDFANVDNYGRLHVLICLPSSDWELRVALANLPYHEGSIISIHQYSSGVDDGRLLYNHRPELFAPPHKKSFKASIVLIMQTLSKSSGRILASDAHYGEPISG
jgi:hypothetical protein